MLLPIYVVIDLLTLGQQKLLFNFSFYSCCSFSFLQMIAKSKGKKYRKKLQFSNLISHLIVDHMYI